MDSQTTLRLLAPVSGVMVPLESVPDPVFAGRMVGDGVAIDPTGRELRAPLAGELVQLHPSRHALTIRGEGGLEVLVHVGLDTVKLRGEGFTPLVREGDRVVAGQPLLRFEADRVARRARSLLTEMVIANGDLVCALRPRQGLVAAGRDVALEVDLAIPETGAHATQAGDSVTVGPVRLPNPAGLHARPAALLAAEAKRFLAELKVIKGDRSANAKSLVALMGLGTAQGDALSVQASGPDAREAAESLAALLASGCGESEAEAPVAAAPAPPRVGPADADESMGVSASPGLAVGRAFHLKAQAFEVSERGGTTAQERARLDGALAQARQALELLRAELREGPRAKILEAHEGLLSDPEIVESAIRGLSAGQSAGFAWQEAYTRTAAQLEAMDNALLRERANDVRDVGRRVLALIVGAAPLKAEVPPGSILLAEELSVSETAQLDPARVLGFGTTTGGATGHVAILARSLGIPAVCGLDAEVLAIHEGQDLILDGTRGSLRRNPTPAQLEEARSCMAAQAARREAELEASGRPAQTKDGLRVEVVANVRNAEEAREGVARGAEGVGLLRSEFLFQDRATAPDEAEQAEAYAEVARALGPERTLVIRTLDVGGDKPLPYLPLPREENPFLGLRGIRVGLERPDLLRIQLRAILRAAPLARLHVMFPMIALLEELREAKAMLRQEAEALGAPEVKVGIMVEVPSAALMAEAFAREADFFSIGTNDLTQYGLAMDRGHARLAKKADGLHPAVLRMIGMTCEGAQAHGKWVGVCGGIASDPMAVPVLLGLGVREFSVSVPAVPAVKATLARFTLEECRQLAREVLALGTADEVRARLSPLLD